jgi:putative tryptophan/tyrosine transport system substrate-binding protein
VILATGSGVPALKEATRTVPIVFTIVPDPVGLGFVDSLARPRGNITGFLSFEYGISGKWLEILKQVSTSITRAAVIRDPAIAVGVGQFAGVASVGPALGVEIVAVNVSDPGEIENVLSAFGRLPNGGMVVTGSASALMHRDLIVKLAAQHRIPAIYYERSFVTAGGLISYGSDFVDQYRRAAGYVDRIFKGEKPADLPVQAPTKYELVINLKTAKALGLEIPPSLLARADEVIE